LDAPARNYKISLIDGNPERAHCKRPEPAAPERRAGAATTRAGEARARHDRYDHSKNAGLLTRLGCNYPLPNRIWSACCSVPSRPSSSRPATTKTDKLPSGGQWLHEIKHDGFRVIARKNGAQVRLYSRPGNDLTHRFPLIVETLARLRSRSCIIDGEAVACDHNGVASFDLVRFHRANERTFLYAGCTYKRSGRAGYHLVTGRQGERGTEPIVAVLRPLCMRPVLAWQPLLSLRREKSATRP
jgi:hypothetical protein